MCGWHGSDGTVRGEGSDGDSRGWTAACVLVPCQEGDRGTNWPGSDRKHVWSGTGTPSSARCQPLRYGTTSLLHCFPFSCVGVVVAAASAGWALLCFDVHACAHVSYPLALASYVPAARDMHARARALRDFSLRAVACSAVACSRRWAMPAMPRCACTIAPPPPPLTHTHIGVRIRAAIDSRGVRWPYH